LYRLKRIEKVPVTPSIYSVAGTAFHEWTDRFDEAPFFEGRDDWYANRIGELIREEEEKSGFPFKEWDNPARKAGANQAALDKFRDVVGPDMVGKYIRWRADSGWAIADMGPCLKCDGTGRVFGNETGQFEDCELCEGQPGRMAVPGIEVEVNFTIQGVENIAKIDRIFEIPETGQLVAIDTKTWSKRRVTAQLPTYLVALRQAGFNVHAAGYYEARKGACTALKTYEYWDENRLAALHVQAAWMIKEQWFLPRPSDACGQCDVRRHCVYRLD
jgi:hypothetical protein